MESLAALLKKRRAELDVSQEVAAVQIGTTRATFNGWEAGKTPSLRWIDAVSEWLDEPAWKVLNGWGLLPDEDATVLASHYPDHHQRKEVFSRRRSDVRKHLAVTRQSGACHADSPALGWRPAAVAV